MRDVPVIAGCAWSPDVEALRILLAVAAILLDPEARSLTLTIARGES